MCGRYGFVPGKNFDERFQVEHHQETLLPSYNVAPGATMPVVVRNSPNRVELMKWGLMAPTDLAGRVGMVFVFPGPTTESFYMRNTPMPLSIAWFDGSGRFVSAADMVPCADVPNCPLYSAARAYRYALEVPRGGLGGLGAGPGSQLTVGGAC